MAKTDNQVADGAAPDAYPLSVEEFLSRLSQTDKRVELLGAFHAYCLSTGLLVATEADFLSALSSFAKRPA